MATALHAFKTSCILGDCQLRLPGKLQILMQVSRCSGKLLLLFMRAACISCIAANVSAAFEDKLLSLAAPDAREQANLEQAL